MLARTVSSLPTGSGWAFEPKFDGYVRHEVHVIEGGGRPLRRIVAAMR
jgi:ATP-dependent DNA ligase